MIHVYLVTHGPTEWDVAKKIYGASNVPLSPDGCNQARIIAKMMQERTYQKIYCSDLDRSYVTAKELALYRPAEIHPDSRLNDWNFGIWEGLAMSEVLTTYQEKYEDWRKNPMSTRVTKGETAQEFLVRIWEFFEQVIKASKDDIACVIHRRVFIALGAYLKGGSPSDVKIEIIPITSEACCQSFVYPA